MLLPSPELLDEELEAEETGHPRTVMIGFTLVMVAVAAGLLFGRRQQKRAQRWEHIAVVDSRLCRAGSDRPLRAVERGQATPLAVRLTVRDVPPNEPLLLDCQWIDPAGQVAIEQRYRTRPAPAALRSAYAEQVLPPHARAGNWTVRLLVAEREVSRLPLEVRDAGAKAGGERGGR